MNIRFGAFASLIVLSGTNCSTLFVRKAPVSPPENRWVMCTETKLMPLTDAVFSVLLLSPLVYFAAFDRNSDSRTLKLIAGVPVFGTGTVLFSLSAINGFSETSRCAALHEAYEEPLRQANQNGGNGPSQPKSL